MSNFVPRVPDITITELREQEPEMYETMKAIIEHFAMRLFFSKEVDGLGLEEGIERIESLIDKGWVKPIWKEGEGEDNDLITMGCFNPLTGEYDLRPGEEGFDFLFPKEDLEEN